MPDIQITKTRTSDVLVLPRSDYFVFLLVDNILTLYGEFYTLYPYLPEVNSGELSAKT